MSAAAPRLSGRLPWEAAWNRLARAVAERRARGLPILDLTETNPTKVELAYPEVELAEFLRGAASPDYPAHPLGLPEAREALAATLSRPGDPVSPDDLVLTASTSEAYSFLFKLFADPGDEVLTAAPSYPLLDSLTALDALALRHFPLEPGRRFALDPGAVERALTPCTRLVVVVHPGNPTGSFLSLAEREALTGLCASHGLPLISDEVFADYPLADPPALGGSLAALGGEALCLALGGLSKSAALPSWKLGWIRLGGPAAARRRILAGLELVADSYLSVSVPVQRALPGVLALAPRIRTAVLARLHRNFAVLAAALADLPAVQVLAPEGGWSAVLRVPRLLSDEELALGLLERAGVLVHPGYFFDFATEGYLVLSLLPEPAAFAEGVRRLAAHLGDMLVG